MIAYFYTSVILINGILKIKLKILHTKDFYEM